MHEGFAAFAATVRESNRQGVDAWERFASHRERVQRLLTEVAGANSSLCLLGAGNLNDVRLDELLDRFGEVHLVDLDVESTRAALRRQGLEGRSNCRVHAPVDLTGVLDRLPAPEVESPRVDAGGLVETLERTRCRISGAPFDVTASTAVLTQLLQSVVDSALPHPETVQVCLALRDKHLADLIALTRPGGTFVLVSDVVSTSTAPGLASAAGADLEEALAALVADKNFFTGTNPYRIVALLEEDPRSSGYVTNVALRDPWLWAVTSDREHLTYAIVARRTLA